MKDCNGQLCYVCVFIAVHLCCICVIHLSHTHHDVIVAFTYKWFHVLVWLLLYSYSYSFHVNYIRSFRITIYIVRLFKQFVDVKCISNLNFWTLNNQHAYVECELKKISYLYWPVLSAVRKNWASVTQQRGKILRKNLGV